MDIKIGPETSGISLARYAKRNDPIGIKARAEQQRRMTVKKTSRKKISEEVTTGDVRGLGNITGNPLTDKDAVQQYQETNIATADTHNDILNKVLDRMHRQYHARTGALKNAG
jgi:hypothetical protein